MTTLLWKVSHKEQHSVIHFIRAKELANAIHSDVRPVYGDNCFPRQANMLDVISLLTVEKVLLRRNDLTVVLF